MHKSGKWKAHAHSPQQLGEEEDMEEVIHRLALLLVRLESARVQGQELAIFSIKYNMEIMIFYQFFLMLCNFNII